MPGMGLNIGIPFQNGSGISGPLRDLSQWLSKFEPPATAFDRSGNELDAEYKDSPALLFDGVGDYAEFGGFDIADRVYTLQIQYTAGEQQFLNISLAGGVAGVVSATFNGLLGGSATLVVSANAGSSATGGIDWKWYDPLIVGQFYTFQFTIGADYLISQATLDGVPLVTTGAATSRTDGSNDECRLGMRGIGAYAYSGILVFFSVQGYTTISFSEASGWTLYDTSGNSNNGEITSTSGLTTMRAARQDVFFPNLLHGCSKVTNFLGDGTDTVASYAATDVVLGSSYEFTIKANCAADHTVSGTNYYISRYPRIEFLVTGGGVRYLQLYDETSALVSSPYDWEMGIDYEFGLIVNSGAWSLSVNGVEFASGVGYIPPTSGLLIGAQRFAWKGYVWEVELNGISLWKAANAYDTTWPDLVGSNNAILVNTEFLYFPVLDGGNDDVAGLGITNTRGITHNFGPQNIKQKNETLLDHEFWSADGINYDTKSIGDIKAHINFDNNVVFKWDSNCFISAALTWPIGYEWIPATYNWMVARLGTNCGAGTMTPLVDGEGEYVLAEGAYLILTRP